MDRKLIFAMISKVKERFGLCRKSSRKQERKSKSIKYKKCLNKKQNFHNNIILDEFLLKKKGNKDLGAEINNNKNNSFFYGKNATISNQKKPETICNSFLMKKRKDNEIKTEEKKNRNENMKVELIDLKKVELINRIANVNSFNYQDINKI